MKDLIIEYRKQNGLTQAEMAKKCGISVCTIGKLEKGSKPSVITEGKISKIIGGKQ